MKKIKLSENTQNILGAFVCVFFAVLIFFLASIVSGCTNNAKADIPENELLKLKMELVKKDSLVKAYHDILYRVWIDKPVYVTDVLSETDEFDNLFRVLCTDWVELFEFKNEEDSMAYEMNWANEDPYNPGCIRVVRHVVIPQHTQEKIDSVFGK